MRKNSDRRQQAARRKYLFQQLKLQADILCDSHEEGRQSMILGRMMNILLDILGPRSLNETSRKTLAEHFKDSLFDKGSNATVELGGPFERNALRLDGVFDIGDLTKRLTWSDTRSSRTIEGKRA